MDCTNLLTRSRYRYSFTLGVVSRVQHVPDHESDIERVKNWVLVHLRRSKGECRTERFGCGFLEGGPLGQIARSEGTSWYFGLGSFEVERGPIGKPTSPYFVGTDQKRQTLVPVVTPKGLTREPIRHAVVDCLLSHSVTANCIVRLCRVQLLENHLKWLISRKPEVKIWRKHAGSIFWLRFPIRLL